MKCNKKPFNNETAETVISGIIEVLVPLSLWQRIKKVKKKNPSLTYSWISRYALFKLLRRSGHERFIGNPKLQRLRKDDRNYSKAREKCHRHSLCLYGSDEESIQQLSLELRISISALVRIALLWYLQELEVESIPPSFSLGLKGRKRFARISLEKILYLGTKIVKEKKRKTSRINSGDTKVFYHFSVFREEDFWPIC